MSTTERRERGATIPIVALALPVLILMTAFAVDLGHQRSLRRTMQARADVIALDMARLADGRDSLTIYSDALGTTEAALQASADRNEIDRANIIEVIWGEYDPSMTPLPFRPHHQANVAPLAGLIPDAVKITTRDSFDYFFQPGSGSATRTAVATGTAVTSLTVGSVGAALQTALPGAAASASATVQA
ncbi:MAG: pilus assembly protein TadG-related protein, partial [Acidimicrobiales bacterium]